MLSVSLPLVMLIRIYFQTFRFVKTRCYTARCAVIAHRTAFNDIERRLPTRVRRTSLSRVRPQIIAFPRVRLPSTRFSGVSIRPVGISGMR